MSTPQVGQGAVAIFPTFKGFRREVVGEVDSTTKVSGQRFTKGFSSAGDTAGRGFASGFKRQTSTVSGDALKKATDDVAKATRELSRERLKEQDVVGKVRVAEAALADARRRYASDSTQVIRAEERLASTQRSLLNVQESVENSTERLAAAKKRMGDASTLAQSAGGGAGGWRRIFSGFGDSAADSFGGRFRSRVGEIFTGNFLAGAALNLGGVLARGIGTGIRTGIQFGFSSIQLASDLGESLNATQVTFGEDIAEQLRILGQDAPTRLALSRRAFAQYATQFSAFAKTIRRDNPVDFIDELTERGADFASVYNLEVDEALNLFQSGLAGETEPLRRYGLNLSAATVESFAYANGIGTVGQALTENEKIQARWALLLEQTSAVQGDNANTSGELAGQQRRLATAFEETQTKLGEFLLPGFLSLVTTANDQILPVFGDIIERVGPGLGEALEKVDWAGFAADIAPAIEKIGVLTAEDGIPALVDGLKTAADVAPTVFESINNDIEDFTGLVKVATGDFSPIYEGNPWLGPFQQSVNETFAKISAVMGDRLAELGIEVEQDLSALPPRWGGALEASMVPSIDEGFRSGLRATKSGLESIEEEFDKAAEANRANSRSRGGSFDAGASFGEGLAKGIASKDLEVGRAARNIARTAERSIRSALEIRSPSRVARRDGAFWTEGVALGMTDEVGRVERAARQVAGAALLPTSRYMSTSQAGQMPAIYVQNPFTGEYLLARTRTVADEAVRDGKESTAAAVAGGVVR